MGAGDIPGGEMEATVRLAELAERIGCTLEGDGTVEIRGVRGLEDAGPEDLAFVAHERYLGRLQDSRAAAIILGVGFPSPGRPALRAANPYLALARALAVFHSAPRAQAGIHPTAVTGGARVDPQASIGPHCVLQDGVEVGPGTVLEAQVFVGTGARIGRDCRIYPQVTLRESTWVGDRVTIHSGAVVGADGFGFARDGARYVKIPQVGRVVIEDDVEVGANTTIDRATLGETRIGRGTKLDNLVQVGHNVQIGQDTVIVAQVGVSGSTRIGSRVTLAGQVGVVDHVNIGDDVIIGAQAGVTKDIQAGSVVLGSPAVPHREFKRQLATIARLPELAKTIKLLEARLEEMENRLSP